MTHRPKPTLKQKQRCRTVGALLCGLLFAVSLFLYLSASWFQETYGDIGIDAMLFTLTSNLDGTSSKLIRDYLSYAVIPSATLLFILILLSLIHLRRKLVLVLFQRRLTVFPASRIIACAVFLLSSAGLILTAADKISLFEYIESNRNASTLYETYYVSPADVQITFPENKRNLIYIYLESMETSFFSLDKQGGMAEHVIPELYDLAENHINFSDNDSVGGYYESSGATWTMGALTAHSCGLPLKLPETLSGNDYGVNGSAFFPGVTTLSDILHENGYIQAFLCGSNADFGGRKSYYTQHGVDIIYDHTTAMDDGIIPQGFREWWGMSDHYLYDYAKQELPKLADSGQPFALTMLTVDTHHIDGFVCPYCEDQYEQQYKNVFACASQQVTAFLEWLQQQSFYENTTVIISGDHASMDKAFMSANLQEGYVRKIYNCIVNSPITPIQEKNRSAVQMDMFPTTLAALGCTIEGDRLGLGTNLFSSVPTLCEEMGYTTLNQELRKKSLMYYREFLLP